jgi:hypothetical protein
MALGETTTVDAAIRPCTLLAPLTPSLVAVTVLDPARNSLTTPALDTPTASGTLELQSTVRPLSTCLLASYSVAVSCCVCPTRPDTEVGVTTTLATGAVLTVTLTDPSSHRLGLSAKHARAAKVAVPAVDAAV